MCLPLGHNFYMCFLDVLCIDTPVLVNIMDLLSLWECYEEVMSGVEKVHCIQLPFPILDPIF